VFAIAITLLVLDIGVPVAAEDGLARALVDQWPDYAAYVVSFMTIGITWINHHAVVANLTSVDRTLLVLNLVLLLWVGLIPWPTKLTAEFMRTGGADERTAAVVYAGVMAAMGATFGSMWRYATNGRRLVAGGLSDDEIRHSTFRFRIGAPVYLLAMVIALVSAPASLAVIGALAVYYLLPGGGAIPHPAERA
jgi:TMEM175 potassium channel family protein